MSAPERWCCPACGTLNKCDGTHSGKGWCQGGECVELRTDMLALGIRVVPEWLLAFWKWAADA